MRILLLGSGGREHAFAWRLQQSSLCEALFIAPGNAGTERHGTNVEIDPNDFPAVKKLVLDESIDLVVVGPEEPLVRGIVDFFDADAQLNKVLIVGPSQEAAMLEGSKAFAKEFMREFVIPTAAYEEFKAEDLRDGLAYIESQTPPIVLKADGLAAGKGVVILDNIEEAKREFQDMLAGKFGAASETVVIEQFLKGIEFSVFVVTDGKDYKVLPVAKDYKRIGEGDTGLNTGGMGSISPVSFVDDEMMRKVENRIIKPTIHGIQERGMNYKGFIFLGLIVVEGDPYVIEYNCRMGDPETQSVFARLNTDLAAICEATAAGRLKEIEINTDERAAASIILVSGGYPGSYEKGKAISGLEKVEGSLIFHAGTRNSNGTVVTNGGRVIAVTAYGPDFRDALKTALSDADKVAFEGKYNRSDIGFDL